MLEALAVISFVGTVASAIVKALSDSKSKHETRKKVLLEALQQEQLLHNGSPYIRATVDSPDKALLDELVQDGFLITEGRNYYLRKKSA